MRSTRILTRLCAIASANLMIVAATLALTSSGCSASTRAKALQATFATTNVAFSTYAAWDAAHHKQLIDTAVSASDATAKILAWHLEELKIQTLFDAVYTAIDGAQKVNDKPSLATVEAASAALAAELAKFIGGAP